MLSCDTSIFPSPGERFGSIDDGCEELDVADMQVEDDSTAFQLAASRRPRSKTSWMSEAPRSKA